MALAVMLFGLNVAPLLDAIEMVESERGKTSDNLYQIEQVYLDDLTRIYNRIYAQSIDSTAKPAVEPFLTTGSSMATGTPRRLATP